MSILKRIGSIVRTGLLWVVLWIPVSLVVGSVRELVVFGHVLPRLFLPLAAVYGMTGFVTGCGFATVMSLTEAGNALSRLKLWRVGSWGALGALVIPIGGLVAAALGGGGALTHVGFLIANLAVTAGLGAGCAVGMVQLGRRGERLTAATQTPMLPLHAE